MPEISDEFDHMNEEYEADIEDVAESNQTRLRKLALLTIVTATLLVSIIPTESPRIRNSRNDRHHALQYVRSWDDDMFRRQFRICREDFGNLLHKIAPLISRNEAKAIASSGSSINPELR